MLTTNPPRGQRAPLPDLLPGIVRGLWLLVLCFAFAGPFLTEHIYLALRASRGVLASPPTQFGGMLLLRVLEQIRDPARLLALAGLLVVLGELFLALAVVLWQCRPQQLPVARLCVRRPVGALVLPGADRSALVALHSALLRRTPLVVLELRCAADEPVETAALVLGVDPASALRAAVAAALRGAAPDAAVIDAPTPDAPDLVRYWREYRHTLPAQYPGMIPGAPDQADPYGPLLAALRPSGAVAHLAFRIIVRPRSGPGAWALDRGWRAHATALKLALEQKLDYALAPDARALEAKLNDPSFDATILIEAAAPAAAAREAARALDTLGAAVGAFGCRVGGRQQRCVPVRAGQTHTSRSLFPRVALPPRLLLPIPLRHTPTLLVAGELAALWRLPDPTRHTGLVRTLSARQRPAPPHAFVVPGEPRIIFGHATRADGSSAPVGPTLRDLRQVLHLTAGMGAGKSRLLANLCGQFAPHGFTLIDGKGDDAAGSLVMVVRERLALADEARLAIIDPLDTAWPVAINPLARLGPERAGSTDLVLGQALAVFARLDPETWGKAIGMQQFAQMATLLVLAGEPQPTFAHIKRALSDDAYRALLLPQVTNPEVQTFWRTTYPGLSAGQLSSRDALLRRIDALLTAETTRYLVTQATPMFTLLEAIEERAIVLVPLPDMTLGGLAGAVGTMIFQAFVRAAFARDGSDTTRTSYPLVIDELQVLLGGGESKDIEIAITRLRSLGIPAVYAHQALQQLGDLAPLMLINAANRVILQTQDPDAAQYAALYAASGLVATDIAGQEPNEHQYAVFRVSGQPAGPLSLRPLPWPAPTSDDPPAILCEWQAATPTPHDPADAALLALVYGAAPVDATAQRLAALDDVAWRRLGARWDQIRLHQRALILANPGCIPERLERQRWLSRLRIARPRVLAAAEYLRMRQE